MYHLQLNSCLIYVQQSIIVHNTNHGTKLLVLLKLLEQSIHYFSNHHLNKVLNLPTRAKITSTKQSAAETDNYWNMSIQFKGAALTVHKKCVPHAKEKSSTHFLQVYTLAVYKLGLSVSRRKCILAFSTVSVTPKKVQSHKKLD